MEIREATATAIGLGADDLVRAQLGRIGSTGDILLPAQEAKIHHAIDLLRSTKASPDLVARVEAMSCLAKRMRSLQMEGRINAYASSLLRLRRAAQRL